MKLLGSTEDKITKNKDGQNIPHLKITEVVLVHCDIVNNDYQQDSRVFQINRLVAYQKFLQQIIIFLKTFNSEYDEIKVWFMYQNS